MAQQYSSDTATGDTFKKAYSALRPLPLNTDRIVEITVQNYAIENEDDKNWRLFLPTIMEKGISHLIQNDAGRQSMIEGLYDSGVYKQLAVPPEVCLTAAQFPNLDAQLAGKLALPFEDLLNKLPGKVKAVITAAQGISSIVNSFTSGADSGGTSNQFAPYLLKTPAYNAEGTDGLDWTSTFEFRIGQFGLWNAKTEVVLPILNLMAPTLLRYIDPVVQQGPFPTVWDLVGQTLKYLWNNISAITDGDQETTADVADSWNDDNSNFLTKLANSLEHIVLSAYNGFMYKVTYGRFLQFTNVIIKNAKLQWSSNEVDQDGFPIAGNVELSFHTIAPASLTSSSNDNMAMRFGVEPVRYMNGN